jgi:hypothetical protein
VIDTAILPFGSRPSLPAIRLVEDVGVFPAVEYGLGRLVLLEAIQILQEEEP